MYIAFCILDLVVLAVLMVLFTVCLRFTISQSKNGFLMLIISMVLITMGMYYELTMSDSVGAALMTLKFQYVGLIINALSIMFFIANMAKFRIPSIVYRIIGLTLIGSYLGLMTTSADPQKNHGLFYTSMELVEDGAYQRISVGGGVLWYIFYVTYFLIYICLMVKLVMCAVNSRKVQRKRCVIMFAGMAVVMVELTLKGVFHIFGSYNPFVIALMIMIICMYIAIVKYGYLNSMNSAAANALNHGEEGVLLIDEVGKIIFMNDILKKLMPELAKFRKANEHAVIFSILFKNKRRVEIDGMVYEAKVEVISDDGNISGYMIWFINVNEYHANLQRLNAASKAKTQYLAVVSHEIRTPVNTIMGMNEMIRRTSKEKQCLEYSADIAAACDVLLSLLSEVLDISKIEAGKLSIINEEYEISSLVNDIATLSSQRAEEKGLVLNINVDRAMPSVLMGDFAKIRQMVINIVINSIKYTDKGTVTVDISMTEGETPKLSVRVTDTGRGIKPEDLERIFQFFERVDENGDGYGLGLTLSKKIALSMNGDITAESVFGNGSCFTICIPQEVIDRTPVGEINDILKAQKNAEQKTSVLSAEGINILGVDDNHMNLVVLCRLLERTKANVDTASGGEEAVRMTCKKRYDIILLDAMMPGMDGTQTLNAIRSNAQSMCKTVPVIVVSANAAAGARERYLLDGFNDYISKPLRPEALEKIILKNLGTELTAAKSHIDIDKGLSYSDDDMEFYKTLRSIFAEEIGSTLEKLNEALSQNDFKLFRITVHSLKNNAASIGAEALSGLCLNAEKDAESENEKALRLAMEEIVCESNLISGEIKTAVL